MSGQQQQQDDKNSMHILWAMFGVFLLGAIIWYLFSDQIKQLFILIRRAELNLIYSVVKTLPDKFLTPTLTFALAELQQVSSQTLNLDIAANLSKTVGIYFRIPCMVVVAISGVYIYSRHVKQRYKKTYNMTSLLEQEYVNWPQVNPIKNLNLLEQDLDKGPWAMAITPMQFAKKHDLLKIELVPPAPGVLDTKNHFKTTIIKEKADKVFAAQLGKSWQGVDRLADHTKALLAVFIARGCRDGDKGTEILERLARSAATKSGNLDLTGVDFIIRKHFNSQLVQDIVVQHAYTSTLMKSLLIFAREDGVLAAADFIWLKPIDRQLWYTLNSVGRQTPAVESAGIYSHWLCEKALRRALTVPMVQEATKALQLGVNDVIYKPTREEENEIIKEYNASVS